MRLFAPQKPWHVFVLLLASCGLYLCVWFYRQGRNLTQLDDQRHRPFLWFLVPLFAISIPFAASRLASRLEAIAERRDTKLDAGFAATAVITMVLSVIVHFSDRIGGPMSVLVACITLTAVLFARVTARLNRFYDGLQDVAWRTPPYRFTAFSWVVTVVLGLLMLTGMGVGIAEDANKYLRPRLPIDVAFAVPNSPLRLRARDTWSIVEVGTNSDGSALLELIGLTGQTFALVFDNGPNTDHATLIENRRSQIAAEDAAASCSRSLALQDGRLFRRADLRCRSERLGQAVRWVVVALESEQRYYELYARGEAPAKRIEQLEAELERLAAGVRLDATGAGGSLP